MKSKKQIPIALLSITFGLYYLISELITIYQTNEGLMSYKAKSISHLGILDTPFHSLMNSALILDGFVFAFMTSYIVFKRYNKNIALLSFITGIFTMGVGFFPLDSILFLHYISTAIVFSTGNILQILSGIYEKKKYLKTLLILNGSTGLISSFLIFFYKPLLPIFERLAVYPIIIYQIAISIIYICDIIVENKSTKNLSSFVDEHKY